MTSDGTAKRRCVVLVRDDQIATINPALQAAEAAVARGELDAIHPIYILDDETIAETRPSLCRLHYLFFRLWRLGERLRESGTRLEFRQGEFGYQLAQYVQELAAVRVYLTTDETDLGQRQTSRIRRAVEPLEIIAIEARPGAMSEEQEKFVPYWELFSEEELETMGL